MSAYVATVNVLGRNVLRHVRSARGRWPSLSWQINLKFVLSFIWIFTLLSLMCVLVLLYQTAKATDNLHLQILVASNSGALFLTLLLTGNSSFSLAQSRKRAIQLHWHKQLAEFLAKAADARQPQRVGHAKAVAYYSMLIAKQMSLSETDCRQMELAGLLHDTGKIAVPDAVLQKQGKLTPQELRAVHMATVESANWLHQIEGLQEVALILYHQNEHWDGTGVPDRLAGEEIPLGSRILAVALRFAAMTQPRADRSPMSVVGGAIDILVDESGKTLDPQAVRAFLAIMGRSL